MFKLQHISLEEILALELDKKSVIEVDLLTKYLSYAKRGTPELTKEAEAKILDYYLQMRNVGV